MISSIAALAGQHVWKFVGTETHTTKNVFQFTYVADLNILESTVYQPVSAVVEPQRVICVDKVWDFLGVEAKHNSHTSPETVAVNPFFRPMQIKLLLKF